ncbi:hypothetical protein J7J59_01825 [Candidatus Aerophobetes bacterium]|nr:hypothetical protein [Candidatus Aerophobetes bacterium]
MIVFDSSTLILLAKIELLRQIVSRFTVIITKEVEKESTRKECFEAKVIARLIKEKKIVVEEVTSKKSKEKLRKDFNIELGEASALLLAKIKNCPLATDDGPTIRACKIMNIKFVTAIHFLIKECESKSLSMDTALIKLEKLKKYGRYNLRIIEDVYKRIEGR